MEKAFQSTHGVPMGRENIELQIESLRPALTGYVLSLLPQSDACDDIGAPVYFMGMVHPDANNGGASGYASTVSNQSWVQLPKHIPSPIPAGWDALPAGSTIGYGATYTCPCDKCRQRHSQLLSTFEQNDHRADKAEHATDKTDKLRVESDRLNPGRCDDQLSQPATKTNDQNHQGQQKDQVQRDGYCDGQVAIDLQLFNDEVLCRQRHDHGSEWENQRQPISTQVGPYAPGSPATDHIDRSHQG